jgi:type IV pilus assembly protein PilY1
MVYVGTGKFFEPDDLTDSSTQSFYGVLDTTTSSTPPPYSRSNGLVQQTIGASSTTVINGVTQEAATTSSNPVSYKTGDRGFFMDLTVEKERVLAQAQYLPYSRSKGSILITTFLPTGDACTGGNDGFWIELDALSGAKPDKPLLFKGENRVKLGAIPPTHLGGSGSIPALGDMGAPCNGDDCGGTETLCGGVMISTVEGSPVPLLKSCGAPGRKSWRQLR